MRPLWLFSNAKAGENTGEKILHINLPGDPAKAVSCAPIFLRRQFRCHPDIMRKRRTKRRNSVLKRCAVAFTGDNAGLLCTVCRHHKLAKQSHNLVKPGPARQ